MTDAELRMFAANLNFILKENCPNCNYRDGGKDGEHCQIYKTQGDIVYWDKYKQCRYYNIAEWS